MIRARRLVLGPVRLAQSPPPDPLETRRSGLETRVAALRREASYLAEKEKREAYGSYVEHCAALLAEALDAQTLDEAEACIAKAEADFRNPFLLRMKPSSVIAPLRRPGEVPDGTASATADDASASPQFGTAALVVGGLFVAGLLGAWLLSD